MQTAMFPHLARMVEQGKADRESLARALSHGRRLFCLCSLPLVVAITEHIPIYVAEHVLDEATREAPDEPGSFIDDDEDDA